MNEEIEKQSFGLLDKTLEMFKLIDERFENIEEMLKNQKAMIDNLQEQIGILTRYK